MKKVYYGLNVDFIVGVSQGDEGQDKGVLHLYLIQQNVLAPRFNVGVEEQGGGDRTE